MFPWDRPQLFVWMGIDKPEVREIAFRQDGMSSSGVVQLRLYYRICPVCGRMSWTSSADPWHPKDDEMAEEASRDVHALVARYLDRVRIEIVDSQPWDLDKDVCDPCKDAWQRAPEVMGVVRNLMRMAAYEREQAERARQAEEAERQAQAETERLLAELHRPPQEGA